MSLAEAARVSLENFEILLAELLPNTTTNHKKLNMKTKGRGEKQQQQQQQQKQQQTNKHSNNK